MFKFIQVLSFLGLVVGAQAASFSTNAVYNGAWTGTSSGTPSSNQDNTFNSTTGHPALTVIGGVAAYLDHSTNHFNGPVLVTGDGTGNSTLVISNSTNTFSEGVTVDDGSQIILYNSTNMISGPVAVQGAADFSSFGSSNGNNTLASISATNNASVYFSNSGSGSITNNISSVVIGNNATVDFSNTGSGSSNSSVSSLSISGGNVIIGGQGSTTNISTLNASGGQIQVAYSNGSFGSTHVNNFNLTGPIVLSLYDVANGSDLTSPPSGTFTLFTVDTFTGDASQITLSNTSPFTLVIAATGSPYGITVGSDGVVRINFAPQSGSTIQNASPVGTPSGADFVVNGPVTTGGPTANNTVGTLTFTPGSSLDIFNMLTVTNGPVNLVPTSSLHLGTSPLGNATLNASQLNVAFGASLTGNGTVTGNVVNSGLVSPGNSPGTITVGQNYTQTSTGTLKIEIGGRKTGEYDHLTVDGMATLDGTLQLVRLSNFKPRRGDKFTFLTANRGVNGEFATVESDFPTNTILSPEVVYEGEAVSLEIVRGSFKDYASRWGLTANQRAVAGALDRVSHDDVNHQALVYLDGRTLQKLPGDFDKIAPEELSAIFTISTALATVQGTNLQRRAEDIRSGANGFSAAGLAINGQTPSFSGGFQWGVAGPTGSDGKDVKESKPPVAPEENKWGAFLSGTGEWIDVEGDGNARGFDITTGGFTVGLDYKVSANFAVGIAAGYTGTTADLTDHGRAWVNGGKLGLYGTYFTGGFYVDGAVTGGYNSYDTKRSALQGTARGSTDGGELNVLAGTGYDFKVGALTIGPTATFQYTLVGMDGFTEHGSLAPLEIENRQAESVRSSVGARASYDWHLGGVVIKPEVRAAWQHEYGDKSADVSASFTGGAGDRFLVNGPELGRDSLLVGAGVAMQLSETVATYVYYDGELLRTNYESSSVTGGVRVAF